MAPSPLYGSVSRSFGSGNGMNDINRGGARKSSVDIDLTLDDSTDESEEIIKPKTAHRASRPTADVDIIDLVSDDEPVKPPVSKPPKVSRPEVFRIEGSVQGLDQPSARAVAETPLGRPNGIIPKQGTARKTALVQYSRKASKPSSAASSASSASHASILPPSRKPLPPGSVDSTKTNLGTHPKPVPHPKSPDAERVVPAKGTLISRDTTKNENTNLPPQMPHAKGSEKQLAITSPTNSRPLEQSTTQSGDSPTIKESPDSRQRLKIITQPESPAILDTSPTIKNSPQSPEKLQSSSKSNGTIFRGTKKHTWGGRRFGGGWQAERRARSEERKRMQTMNGDGPNYEGSRNDQSVQGAKPDGRTNSNPRAGSLSQNNSLDSRVRSRSPVSSERESQSSSIRSNSPLIQHIQERKKKHGQQRLENISRETSPTLQKLVVPDIAEKLKSLHVSMIEDCREEVYYFIATTRNLVHKNTHFDDDESPFSSMKDMQSSEEAPEKIRWDRCFGKKKSPTYLPVKVHNDNGIERVPKFNSHTNVLRNHLVVDNEKLKFIPLVEGGGGDEDVDNFVKELTEAYIVQDADARKMEEISQIRAYLIPWLNDPDIECDEYLLIQYLLSRKDTELPFDSREKKAAIKALGGPLSPESKIITKTFTNAFFEEFNIELEHILLPKTRLKELLEPSHNASRSGEKSASPPDRLGTVSEFECLICHTMCCPTHGEYNRIPVQKGYDFNISDDPSDSDNDDSDHETSKSEYEYAWQRLTMHRDDTLRRHLVREQNNEKDWNLENLNDGSGEHCGKDCYKLRPKRPASFDWPTKDIATLESMLLVLKPEALLPCKLAIILHKPCIEVWAKIIASGPRHVQQYPTGRNNRPDWYHPEHKTLARDWDELTQAHLHQERPQAVPCHHEGPCTKDCPCVENNLLCETICSCPDDCARRFTGCSCHAYGLPCVSNSCICVSLNRECGPLCKSCGAIDRIDYDNRYNDDLFKTGCQNVSIQRGVSKKLIVGESLLDGVGYGLFAGEPIKKGEFLSEYTGEVISCAEAERRGLIYDRKYLSFLFNLNKEWVVDAAKYGNKTRFINHAASEEDGLNCGAKILWVNGEHRIKFIAWKDIEVGQELFFDYGEEFHPLRKQDKIPKAKKEGKKKGVVQGEEALDVLDGIADKKLRRQKVREMVESSNENHGKKRGRPLGSMGKSSKKTANVPKIVRGEAVGTSAKSAYRNETAFGDEMEIEEPDSSFLNGLVQDSDEDDSTFMPRGVDVDGDADMLDAESSTPRTRRRGKMPARYTR